MPIEPWINDMPDDPLFSNIQYDDASFQLLFRRYFAALCAYCQYQYSFDLDLAKEAVHTGFVKLWENRHSVAPELSVKAYLYKIVSNTCLDIIRHQNVKRKYEKYIQQQYSEKDFGHDFDHADVKDLQEAIDKAVSELPEKMRVIFEMSRYEGLKYGQIAERLNISVKTVETQISRALFKLRDKLSRFYMVLWLTFMAAISFF
jgi:RNA polymerase sigma-70 factor (ECF subfamily)